MSKKKITAPLSYDPGKGRPKEYLAYLNWQEMQALQRLNGGNMELGPRGLPSFPPDDSIGSNQTPGSGNWTGSPGGTSVGSGPGGDVGGTTESGNIGGAGTSTSTTSSAASSAASTTSAASQNTTDEAAQQATAVNNAVEAAKNAALSEDARRAGIGSIEVGPMRQPVTIGGGQVFGSLSRVASDAYGLSAPENTLTPTTGTSVGAAPIPRMNPLNDPSKFIQQEANVFSGVNPVALSKIVRLQEEFGSPLTITSGLRLPEENKLRGGAKRSQHIHGNAIDIALPGASAAETARLIDTASGVGFTGIGGYRPGKVHVDIGGTRVWGPTKRTESISRLPSSMQEALRSHASGATPRINIDYASMENQPSFNPDYSPEPISSPDESAINLAEVESSYNPSVFQDPVAAATMAGLAQLPGVLSNFSIPSIPEGSAAQKNALSVARAIMPESAYQSMVNKAVADAVQQSGFSLADTISSGISALNQYAPQTTSVADQQAPVSGPTEPTAEENYRMLAEAQVYPRYVSPERQALIEDQEKKNRIGIGAIKAVPGFGRVIAGGEKIYKMATGEDIADEATRMKYAFEQMSPEQQADAIAKYPDMRRYAVSAGIIPPSTGTQYASAGPPGEELGGKNYEQRYASLSSPYSGSYGTTEPSPARMTNDAMSLREQYLLWDKGIGIPEPGDPDYNDYMKYLKSRGTSAQV